ncbi:MAG: response regulator [bacterium]|nr:response regulator [bacterium]
MDTPRRKILIVDDDAPILRGISDKFTLEGFSVITAKDGTEGLEKALKEHPDLIVTDLLMPNANGLCFVENLRKDDWGKNAHIIVWSNSHNSKTLDEAKRLGVNDFMVKSDWEYKDVVNKAREILDNQ